jgi:thioesterase domain-containing protein
MLLLAAFKALLFKYGGQERIVVGTPIAGRTRAELEALIGFFVNTLVLATDLSGRPTFRELVRRVRDVTLDAYAHQDLPFEKLVEELHPRRDPGRNPLFRVMFAFQEARRPLPPLGSVGAAWMDVGTGTAPFDLTLYVTEGDRGLELAIEYRTALFGAAAVERMLRHYQDLLEAVAAEPERRLEELPPAGEALRPIEEAEGVDAAPPPERTGVRADEARRARLLARRAQLSAQRQALLQERLQGQSGRPHRAPVPGCLVGIRPAGSRPPLFCVHPAGGDVLCYVSLARHLGDLDENQPFFGLQCVGLQGESPPLSTIEEMAARYLREIRQVRRTGPYRLAGWSLGGVVAFEMAQQLREAGERVALLAIVDTVPGGSRLPAPEPLACGAPEDNTRWLVAIADYVEGLWGRKLGVSRGELSALGPEEQLQLFLERLSGFGFLPTRNTLAHLLAAFKASSRAWYAYAPRPYPDRITLFKAHEQHEDRGPTMGWGELTPEPVEVHVIPGDHITLLAEPNVRVLAERLSTCLRAVVSPVEEEA